MSLKKKILVTITKEILVEIPDEMLTDENIEEWNTSLWTINGGDDIAKYAAEITAHHDGGGNFDGIGVLGRYDSIYLPAPDVKFKILYEETEADILGDFESF